MKAILKPFKPVIAMALFGCLSLAACQNNGRGVALKPTAASGNSGFSSGSISNTGALSGIGSSAAPTNGTTDGGGGNGIKGKVLEAYIIHPTQTSAYTQFLAPIFNNVDGQYAKVYGKYLSAADTRRPWEKLFNLKLWYFSPIQLKSIPNKILGLSFSKDGTQQLAFQTKDEVWIDSNLTPSLDTYDSAYLMLHEYVMSLYLLNNFSSAQICDVIRRTGILDKCDLPDVSVSPSHPLDANDYRHVRRMTDWLMENGSHASLGKLLAEFVANGFSSPLFEEGFQNSDQIRNVTPAELNDIFIRTTALNQLPTRCHFMRFGEVPCVINLKVNGADKGDGLQSVQIQLSSPDHKTVYRTIRSTDIELDNDKMSVTPNDDSSREVIRLNPSITNPKIGDTYSNLYLIVKHVNDGENNLVINSAIWVPGVITSAKTESGSMECEGDTPQATDMTNDGLVITGRQAQPAVIAQNYGYYVGLGTADCVFMLK